MPIFRPGKPWRRLTLSADVNVAAGAQDAPFDVEEGDGECSWVGAPGSLLTIEVAGLYLITSAVRRNPAGSAASILGRVEVDGVGVTSSNSDSQATGQNVAAATVIMLDVGQVVGLDVVLHTTLTTVMGKAASHLAIARIGPVRWT